MTVGQQSTSNYPIPQNANSYVLPVDKDKLQSCADAFNKTQAKPPPFKDGQNCSTAAVSIGGACSSQMPSGNGPVSDPYLGAQVNRVNPAALEQQIKPIAAPVYGPPAPAKAVSQ